MTYHKDDWLSAIINNALSEDLGDAGDITSHAIFSSKDQTRAIIKSKETGILSGLSLIDPIFTQINPSLSIETKSEEGAKLKPETEICIITGSIQSILTGERTVLNFLQHLSGIATQTAHLSSLISHTKAKLLDTRKTTPGLRLLEKKAVLAGGGTNHRIGLYDMILIKDTHAKAAGGPANAIKKAFNYCKNHPHIKIEVEIQSFPEFVEATRENPHRIMLDNMGCKLMTECVSFLQEKKLTIELEASGNVTANTISSIAETGVDYISVGALTHSVKALDIHLVLL